MPIIVTLFNIIDLTHLSGRSTALCPILSAPRISREPKSVTGNEALHRTGSADRQGESSTSPGKTPGGRGRTRYPPKWGRWRGRRDLSPSGTRIPYGLITRQVTHETHAMIPGRALDRLIAEKVMGWQNVSGMTGEWKGYPPERSYVVLCRLPYYSRDISDAWEVVEKLASNEILCQIRLYPPRTVRVSFSRDEFQGYEESETAPHAICLAALKAVAV